MIKIIIGRLSGQTAIVIYNGKNCIRARLNSGGTITFPKLSKNGIEYYREVTA